MDKVLNLNTSLIFFVFCPRAVLQRSILNERIKLKWKKCLHFGSFDL